jgi:5-methylthioadenosine/S-adenosylhomocysteine deaminase
MNGATLILKNAAVITMDHDYRIYSDGAVAVKGDRILAVGPSDDLMPDYPGVEIFDCGGKALIPGLINTHTHSPMTLLRGLSDDRRLDVWLLGYMMPVEREYVSPEFCQLGAQIACAEMIRSGITCFADMYYFEDIVASAVAEAGMRAVCAQTVLKFPSPDAEAYEDSLAAAREFLLHWKGHPLITPSVGPHAAYTTTPEILRACTALAEEFDVPLQIHISETSQEVEDWRREHDMPVVPWVKKQGIFEAKVLAAHCVHIDEGEIHTLQHAGAGVAHNPTSNMKLASGFAPVKQMLEAGLAVGIGTDGASSNNDLDMFEEIRLATFLAKGVSGDPTALPAKQVLAMATRMGAKALHMDEVTGSIEPGKKADIVLLDLDTLHNKPHFGHEEDTIYARIIYAAKSTDVTDVMVDGRWLMRDRQLQTLDAAPLLEAAEEYAQRIDQFLIEREESVLSKLIAIGGAQQQESYEVQIKLRIQDPSDVLSKLNTGDLEIVRRAHYLEYDTYFEFESPEEGRLRYREDEFIDEEGEVFNVRYRLTLTGPAAERTFPNSILLSRSRFIAPASHSLRFYREYFDPVGEVEITKDRLRWLARFKGLELFVNLDEVLKPDLDGYFLEIKSRTWSRRDAEHKAQLISELLDVLEVEPKEVVTEEYPDLVKD